MDESHNLIPEAIMSDQKILSKVPFTEIHVGQVVYNRSTDNLSIVAYLRGTFSHHESVREDELGLLNETGTMSDIFHCWGDEMILRDETIPESERYSYLEFLAKIRKNI